jgi:hypothetical protein
LLDNRLSRSSENCLHKSTSTAPHHRGTRCSRRAALLVVHCNQWNWWFPCDCRFTCHRSLIHRFPRISSQAHWGPFNSSSPGRLHPIPPFAFPCDDEPTPSIILTAAAMGGPVSPPHRGPRPCCSRPQMSINKRPRVSPLSSLTWMFTGSKSNRKQPSRLAASRRPAPRRPLPKARGRGLVPCPNPPTCKLHNAWPQMEM